MSQPEIPYIIVAGIDYSPVSDLALERAFELAAEHSLAEVHVVNVVRTMGTLAQLESPADPGFANVSLSDAAEQVRAYAEARLRTFRAGQKEIAPESITLVAHLRLEAAAEEIAQLATDLRADLIVVGTHGRRGVSRLLLGSVAEEVVRLASCPVLVMRERVSHDDRHAENTENEPTIEPPCVRCVEARQASGGAEMWCEQHREHHGRRHTYHQGDRISTEVNMPLVFDRH